MQEILQGSRFLLKKYSDRDKLRDGVQKNGKMSKIEQKGGRRLSQNNSFQLIEMNVKGPVSGFVGRIPLPSLESRINRNH